MAERAAVSPAAASSRFDHYDLSVKLQKYGIIRMSYQHQQATSPSLASVLLRLVIQRIECGQLVVDTPGGGCFALGGSRPGPQAQLTIHRWNCLWRLLTGWDIGFSQSYMAGEWSSPNLPELLNLATRNFSAAASIQALRLPRLPLNLRHALNRNTKRGSRRNIAAHYDLGNDFYAHWLDPGMTYSSGLYSSAYQTLEDAQQAKLRRVIDLLAISGGERVLEIGCGWGSLIEQMLAQHGCTVTGLTLSTEQLTYARTRLQRLRLFKQCDLRLEDYRDAHGQYDRVASIEMLEAVGEAYWPTFFAKLRELLRPRGMAVLQVITIDENRFEYYRRRPDFVQGYIFPGGMLPTVEIIEHEIAQAQMRLVSAEFFGDSYARTLAE